MNFSCSTLLLANSRICSMPTDQQHHGDEDRAPRGQTTKWSMHRGPGAAPLVQPLRRLGRQAPKHDIYRYSDACGELKLERTATIAMLWIRATGLCNGTEPAERDWGARVEKAARRAASAGVRRGGKRGPATPNGHIGSPSCVGRTRMVRGPRPSEVDRRPQATQPLQDRIHSPSPPSSVKAHVGISLFAPRGLGRVSLGLRRAAVPNAHRLVAPTLGNGTRLAIVNLESHYIPHGIAQISQRA